MDRRIAFVTLCFACTFSHYQLPTAAPGCYELSQLDEILATNSTKDIVTEIPVAPDWCEENMVPRYLQNVIPQNKTTCPYEIRAYPFTKSETVLVNVRSKDDTTTIQNIYLSAIRLDRDIRSPISTRRIGRFVVSSESVSLACCNFIDKNAATLNENENNDEMSYNFYWVPHESIGDDYEGKLIFIATIVKSRTDMEYWINVKSQAIEIAENDYD